MAEPVKDANRINMLTGMVKKAAQAKVGRSKQIDDAENEALGTDDDSKAGEVAEAKAPPISAKPGKPDQKAGMMTKLLRKMGL